MPDSAADRLPVRVWDLPTRLFHWLLAVSVVSSVVTANVGGNAMLWHFRLGLFALGLLMFRIVWGFVGGRWSRFASFAYAPATLLRYLRGDVRPSEHLDAGHNPLGSLSVFALLLVLAAQVATGLVADDEIANVGPLNRFVSNATARTATAWHHGWGQWLIVGLVGLHVAAIVVYRVRRKVDLVGPMLHGDKLLPGGTPAAGDGLPQRLLALVVAAGSAAIVLWVQSFAG
jgi:cytochrome b